MQDWRFDELTRSLGTATSRRQVLKGLIGGVAAILVGRSAPPTSAAPFSFPWFGGIWSGGGGADGVCNRQQCVGKAFGLWKICEGNCSSFNGRHGYGHYEDFACTAACFTAFEQERYDCLHNATGCFGGDACCDQQCVNTEGNSQNCGACGHACPEGADCSNGECQCPDDLTKCGEDCIDTQFNHDNCGACGQACSGCETCVAGQCTSVCGETAVCCNDQCVPVCTGGSTPNPETCECDACTGQVNGVECGQGQVCCQEQCANSDCASNKDFSYDTCNCECTSQCPPDQLQDPETCECQDLCANVTCDECHICDPTSGDCVQAEDGSVCSSGTCCAGACTEDGGSCCPDDAYRCYDQTGAVGPCCASGQGCVAKASDAATWDDYTCCPIITSSTTGDNGRPYPALPDGTCCGGANYWVVNCLEGGWTCCDSNNGGLCC